MKREAYLQKIFSHCCPPQTPRPDLRLKHRNRLEILLLDRCRCRCRCHSRWTFEAPGVGVFLPEGTGDGKAALFSALGDCQADEELRTLVSLLRRSEEPTSVWNHSRGNAAASSLRSAAASWPLPGDGCARRRTHAHTQINDCGLNMKKKKPPDN